MRRSGAQLLGVFRQAVAGGVQRIEAVNADAAVCSSRATWLRPPGERSAAAATACAASSSDPNPPAAVVAALQDKRLHHAAHLGNCPRGISSTCRAQHNAEPAHDEAAAAAASPPPEEQQLERTCWQCGTPLTSHDLFFCPECKSVLPASMDVRHFLIFGMDEPVFDLDVLQLEQQYKALQRRLHPDKYATASALEREYAQQQAAAVNQAYDVLKKPLRRAHYILIQRGFGACEGMTITDPELLIYVMEAREEVEGTLQEDKARLQAMLEANHGLEERCIQELSAAFNAGDMPHAAELTTQLRYICRIKEAIVDKM